MGYEAPIPIPCTCRWCDKHGRHPADNSDCSVCSGHGYYMAGQMGGVCTPPIPSHGPMMERSISTSTGPEPEWLGHYKRLRGDVEGIGGLEDPQVAFAMTALKAARSDCVEASLVLAIERVEHDPGRVRDDLHSPAATAEGGAYTTLLGCLFKLAEALAAAYDPVPADAQDDLVRLTEAIVDKTRDR
jgi:hypothetical protein